MKKYTEMIFNDLFGNLEFMKKIVRWAMQITTLYLAIAVFEYYAFHIKPNSLITNLITLIISGVIVAYAAKSGTENVQKIKKAPCSTNNEEAPVEETVQTESGDK
jgi:nucleoside diphosphate kinase